MACSSDFVQYIADQCGGAGEITLKKMFGEYGIYCNGKIFGLICGGSEAVTSRGSASALRRGKGLLLYRRCR